ncbi:aldehyde dehydrogenase family protein [Staphylococcus aureus]
MELPYKPNIIKISSSISAAGRPVVLKPSEETPFAAVILAEIFDKVGVPKGVFNLVNGDGAGVGNPLSGHSLNRVDVILQDQALLVLKLWKKPLKIFKKVSLELRSESGCSLVLDDVDIKEAAKATTGKVVIITGQVCTAGTRVLVPNKIKDAFFS